VSSGYFNVENGSGGGFRRFKTSVIRARARRVVLRHYAFPSWATIIEFPFGKGKKWFQSGPALLAAGQLAGELHYAGALVERPYSLQVTGDFANLRGSASTRPGNYLRPNFDRRSIRGRPGGGESRPALPEELSRRAGRAADAVYTTF
jgi:hypothetical protein